VEIITASQAVSYITKVMGESAKLYESLAQKYAEEKETFLSLAKENMLNKKSIERAYYEIISDKLEACFCFSDLNTDKYSTKTELPEDIDYSSTLSNLLDMEEKTRNFLLDAGKQSKSLVPDVSWIFERMGKKRAERIAKLRMLLDKVAK